MIDDMGTFRTTLAIATLSSPDHLAADERL